MTSFALIAGMIPIAIGLNEASSQRTSMGIALIGGLISSTLLTLVVVPAAFGYIDDFRLWTDRLIRRIQQLKLMKNRRGPVIARSNCCGASCIPRRPAKLCVV